MLIADFTLGDALLTVLEIFLFVIYLWILITGDLFRDQQLSGWPRRAGSCSCSFSRSSAPSST